MSFRKSFTAPTIVCLLLVIVAAGIAILLLAQLSQLLFMHQDYQVYTDDQQQFWTRRRPTFGQRTHRTEPQNEIEEHLAENQGILVDLLADSLQSDRNLNQPIENAPLNNPHPYVQRLRRSRESKQPDEDGGQGGNTANSGLSENPSKWPSSFDLDTQLGKHYLDFVDDEFYHSSNLLNLGNEVDRMDRIQIDASVLSEEDNEEHIKLVPPLSRIVLLR